MGKRKPKRIPLIEALEWRRLLSDPSDSTSILPAAPTIPSDAQFDLDDSKLIVQPTADTAPPPDSDISFAVGYVENSFLPNLGLPSYTDFGGQTVDGGSMLIRFTRGADTNLDGKVNTDDITIISPPTNVELYEGDFAYDGIADGDDVTILGALYDATSPALSQAQLTAQFGAEFAAEFAASQSGQATPPPPRARLTLLQSMSIDDVQVSESGGNAVFRLAFDGPSPKDVVVRYRAKAGSAKLGRDFKKAGGVFRMRAGETEGHIFIPLRDDAVFEGDETFTLQLKARGLTDKTCVATIQDNEAAPTILTTDLTTIEGNRARFNVKQRVTLSHKADVPVSVDFETLDATATSSDFVAARGRVTFRPGQISQNIKLSVLGDRAAEDDKTFVVHLSNPSNGRLSAPATIVTIANDDGGDGLVLTRGTLTLTDPTFVAGQSTITASRFNALFGTQLTRDAIAGRFPDVAYTPFTRSAGTHLVVEYSLAGTGRNSSWTYTIQNVPFTDSTYSGVNTPSTGVVSSGGAGSITLGIAGGTVDVSGGSLGLTIPNPTPIGTVITPPPVIGLTPVTPTPVTSEEPAADPTPSTPVETPETPTDPPPVTEEPAPPATEPVVEEPTPTDPPPAPTDTQPTSEEPRSETPPPLTEPVIEEPAPPATEPVVEEPAPSPTDTTPTDPPVDPPAEASDPAPITDPAPVTDPVPANESSDSEAPAPV